MLVIACCLVHVEYSPHYSAESIPFLGSIRAQRAAYLMLFLKSLKLLQPTELLSHHLVHNISLDIENNGQEIFALLFMLKKVLYSYIHVFTYNALFPFVE